MSDTEFTAINTLCEPKGILEIPQDEAMVVVVDDILSQIKNITIMKMYEIMELLNIEDFKTMLRKYLLHERETLISWV